MDEENSAFTKRLAQIAERSRLWALCQRDKHHCGIDLSGMCAIASGHLHKQLEEAGIESFLAVNYHHCFVVVDDFIVDITATQFGMEPVCIVAIDQSVSHPDFIWHIERKFKSLNELQEYQMNEGWPLEQLADSFLVATISGQAI